MTDAAGSLQPSARAFAFALAPAYLVFHNEKMSTPGRLTPDATMATPLEARRLLLVGPPGSGKGTQAKLLGERLGLTYVGTGEILRESIGHKTPAGLMAEPFVLSGRLVPDELVNRLVEDLFSGEGQPQRFVLDGYPRTLTQAKAFDGVLRRHGLALDAVVILEVDDEEIIQRICGRWECPVDKTTYHVSYKPPKVHGICDLCRTPLLQRQDDREATIRKRLRVFHDNTTGLIPYYAEQGLVHSVNGHGSIEAIYQSIVQAIRQVDPSC